VSAQEDLGLSGQPFLFLLLNWRVRECTFFVLKKQLHREISVTNGKISVVIFIQVKKKSVTTSQHESPF
jgi:hypothetical protein